MQEQKQLLEELKADEDKQAVTTAQQQAQDTETLVFTLQSRVCTLQDALDQACTASAPAANACMHTQTDACLIESLTAEVCQTTQLHKEPRLLHSCVW